MAYFVQKICSWCFWHFRRYSGSSRVLDESVKFAKRNHQIDKWAYGTHVEYMDLEIYRGTYFEKGMFDIRLHQKPEKINSNIYKLKSGHEPHTTSNYVSGELKRCVRSNSKEINFLAVKVKFFRRLLDRGFCKGS